MKVTVVICCLPFSLSKEKQMYEKEVVDEEAKLERMKTDGRDEYDLRKQVVSYFHRQCRSKFNADVTTAVVVL